MARANGGARAFAAGSVAMGVVLGFLGSVALWGGTNSTVRAQATPASASGTIVLNLSAPGNPPRLALVDTNVKALAVYRIDPQGGALKLEASRPYHQDLKLEFNNLEPYSHAIEAMVSPTTRK